VLSNTITTEALFARGAMCEPAKIKSSLRFPRIDFIDCSPSAKRNASATFDFPEPFGPTIAVAADEKSSTVFRANDLNPAISKRFNIPLIVANPYKFMCSSIEQQKRWF
jgi:hypothetical protein